MQCPAMLHLAHWWSLSPVHMGKWKAVRAAGGKVIYPLYFYRARSHYDKMGRMITYKHRSSTYVHVRVSAVKHEQYTHYLSCKENQFTSYCCKTWVSESSVFFLFILKGGKMEFLYQLIPRIQFSM